MRKKKNSSTTRTKRCYIQIKRNSIHYHHFRTLTKTAKSLYNSGLFVRRQFFRITQQYKKTVISNLSRSNITMNDMIKLLRMSWKDNDMLKSLCSLLSKQDLLYVIKKLGTGNSVSSYITKYINTTTTFSDTALPRKTVSMSFQDILTLLESTDDNFLIDTNCAMQVTFLQQLKSTLRSLLKTKAKTTTSLNNTIRDSMLPVLLHKDICYAMVKEHQNSLYTSMPSQVAQYITRSEVDAMYQSYFELKQTNSKAKPPSYKAKDGFHPLTWSKTTFAFETKGKHKYVRLSLGNNAGLLYKQTLEPLEGQHTPLKNSKYNPCEIDYGKHMKVTKRFGWSVSSANNLFCKSSTEGIDTFPMKSLYFRYGKQIDTDNIQQIRLVPKRDGNMFELQFIKKVKVLPPITKPKRVLSMDLGEINLMVAITNVPNLRPWIIDGGEVKYINGCFNHDISRAQSRLEKSSKMKKSTLLNRLWYRREQKLRTLFHLYAKRVIDYCRMFKIDKIIAGYNKNWKCRSRLGKIGNRHFQKVPYRLFLKNLFDKAEREGIEMCENEESFTSKCDAFALESFEDCVNRNTKRRVKRGLYSSITGRLLNADVNGAINIMRKHIIKAHSYLVDQFNTLINTTCTNFMSPIKLKVKNLIGSLFWDAFGSPENRGCEAPFAVGFSTT